MDGLRLALLILGIVVVAVVYFWTARRRRLEREAGDFDRFDAWTNEALDPLAPADVDSDAGFAGHEDVAVDADEFTQPNLRVSNVRRSLVRNADQSPGNGDSKDVSAGPVEAESAPFDATRGAARGEHADDLRGHPSRTGFESVAQAKTEDDLQGVANSARDRVVPQVGRLDDIEFDSPSSEPLIRSSPASAADSSPVSVDDTERQQPIASTSRSQPSTTRQGRMQEQQREAERERGLKRDAAQKTDSSGAAQDTAEMVVVLNVMALANQSFDGPSLKLALESAGLEAGDMQLYHYRTEAQSAASTAIFSALNTVKPGTLAVDEFDGMRTPGIALVLRMHGIERPSEAFELMLAAARRIADELDGQVCDETRSTLTGQALNHLRERISAAAFRARAGS